MADYDDAALNLQAAGMLAGQLNTLGANIENKKLLRENYAWNEKMYQKQLDYNWEMWNKTNEYNSPSAMVQRLVDAGINPALALEKQGATTAANASASPSVGSPGSSSIQAYDPAPVMARASDILLSKEARELSVERAFLDNMDRRNEVYENREMRSLQNDFLRYNLGLAQEDYSFQRDTRGYRTNLARLEYEGQEQYNNFVNEQTALVATQRFVQEQHLKEMPARFAADIAESSARAYNAIKSGDASSLNAEANWIVSQAQKEGYDIDNHMAMVMLKSNIKTMMARNYNERLKLGRENESFEDTNGSIFRKMRRYSNQGRALSEPVSPILPKLPSASEVFGLVKYMK